MYAKIKFKNAVIICLWLCILGLACAAVISVLSFIASVIFFAVWFLIFGVFASIYLCTFKMHIASEHISLRHGILFRFVHRVPLRFVSSCRVFSSPMQRRTKSCIIILLYAGGFFIFPGADEYFANELLQKTVNR